MKKVLIGGSINPLNKGDQARVKACVQKLAEVNSDVKVALLSHAFDKDSEIYADDKIEIVKAPWSRSDVKLTKMSIVALNTIISYSILRFAQSKLKLPVKAKLLEYDAFILISGLDFSDFGGRWPIYYCVFLITLFNMVLGKPFMCYAQSMGPIENVWIRKLSRYYINRAKIISVREEHSIAFLKELNIDGSKVYLTADSAFLLQSTNQNADEVRKRYGLSDAQQPLIGISANPKPFAGPGTGYCSVGIWYKVDNHRSDELSLLYIDKMARICDRLVDNYGAALVFIPNCCAKNDDDREVLKKIYDHMSSQENTVCIMDNLTLSETMALMGMCDFFVGTRLHSIILTAIMGIPVLPLVGTSGPRIPGVLKMIKMDEYLHNIITDDEEEIFSAIDNIWQHRDEMKQVLQTQIAIMRRKAEDNISLIVQEL